MKDDKSNTFQGQFLISKKSHPIDTEPTGKKNKGKNKKYREENPSPEIQTNVKGMTKQNETLNEENLKIQSLYVRFPNYKKSTIAKFLKESGFDQQIAMDRMFDTVPDNETVQSFPEDFQTEEPNKMEKNKSSDNSTSSHEQANNLINEVFDNFNNEQMEINGRQFQELFEQITEMIKADQKQQGIGLFEINSFVDQCNSIKEMLLVGFREELTNDEDYFDVDESNPLYAQTQQFLQVQIKRQNKEQKRKQDDFPTLGAKTQGKSIIQKIKQEYKAEKQKKYEENYFVATKNTLPQFAKQKYSEHTIFNVDNKLRSEKDLKSLNKEFGDVPIYHLKFIYKTLIGDYNLTRQFLNSIRVFEASESPTKKQQKKESIQKKVHTNMMRREEVEEELQDYSLSELREQIDHLFKLRQAFNLAKIKIKSSNQKVQLERISNENRPLLEKLIRAARIKIVEQSASRNPLYVDLHGHREEEIQLLLESMADMIQHQFDKGNEKVRTRKGNGRLQAVLTVMTGKGLHSKGGKSILKPIVIEWCQKRGLKCVPSEDSIDIFIQLN